jgi:hypothetical protein
VDQPTITQTPSPGLFRWESNGVTKGLKTNFMEKRKKKGCQRCQCQNLVGTSKMSDRYAVINPETLKAMRRAGHVAKLEARIKKLEDALRLYACESTCPNCYGQVQDTRYCGWTARKALEKKDD